MKIAIHNGTSWNQRWIKYCLENNINHIVVNCYDSDLIQQLRDEKVTHLLWHFNHAIYADLLMARNILNSVSKMSIKVFPDFDTNWHFDDKVAQKYLLEAIEAPVVTSWVFYNREKALNWVNNEAKYPLVAKLRGGAGSHNVILLKNVTDTEKYIKKLFTKGINPMPNYFVDANNRVGNVLKRGKAELWTKILQSPRKIIAKIQKRKSFNNEKGYVYFQEFLPNNTHDLRIVVIKDKAFGFYRAVRKNDFRASGSGSIDYNMKIPLDVLKKSFETSKKLNTQSVAFDYVMSENGEYKIVEISYGYVSDAIYRCNGYWTETLKFEEGNYYPENIIIENLIHS